MGVKQPPVLIPSVEAHAAFQEVNTCFKAEGGAPKEGTGDNGTKSPTPQVAKEDSCDYPSDNDEGTPLH